MKPQSHSPIFHALALLSITSLCLANKLNTNAITRQVNNCDSESDCPEDQICITQSGKCTDDDCEGVCSEQTICSCKEPCPEGQTCVETIELAVSFITCFPDSGLDKLSPIAKPIDCSNNPNDSSEICVAVHMLHAFRPHQLVFEKHAYARVLCDFAASCATRGHIVSYRGSVMMMQSYCKLVGCRHAVMQVNSPRFRLGLKVSSRSPDMHFTAFAARYATQAEEAILAAAVRIGL